MGGSQPRARASAVSAAGADAVEMMFGKPDHFEAQLIGKPRLAQGFVNHLPIALGIAAFREQEVAELQAALLWVGVTPRGRYPHT